MDLKPFAHQELLETLSLSSTGGGSASISSRNGHHHSGSSVASGNNKFAISSSMLSNLNVNLQNRGVLKMQQQTHNNLHGNFHTTNPAANSMAASVSNSHVDEAYRRLGQKLSMQAHGDDEHTVSELRISTRQRPKKALRYSGPATSSFLPYSQYNAAKVAANYSKSIFDAKPNHVSAEPNNAKLQAQKVTVANDSDYEKHTSNQPLQKKLSEAAINDVKGSPHESSFPFHSHQNGMKPLTSDDKVNVLKRLTFQASDFFRKWQEERAEDSRHKKVSASANLSLIHKNKLDDARDGDGIAVTIGQGSRSGNLPSQSHATVSDNGWENGNTTRINQGGVDVLPLQQPFQQQQQKQQEHLTQQQQLRLYQREHSSKSMLQQNQRLRLDQSDIQLRQDLTSGTQHDHSSIPQVPTSNSMGKGLLSVVMENSTESNSLIDGASETPGKLASTLSQLQLSTPLAPKMNDVPSINTFPAILASKKNDISGETAASSVTHTAGTNVHNMKLSDTSRPLHDGLKDVPLQLKRGQCLTVPPESVSNHGFDNSEGNLIVYENDVIIVSRYFVHTADDIRNNRINQKQSTMEYRVEKLLGQGTFAQVFQCLHIQTGQSVAVKIVKSKPAYTRQATVEIEIFRALFGDDTTSVTSQHSQHFKKETSVSPKRDYMVNLICYFMYQSHLCLVFELLGLNLYEVLKKRQFRGLPLSVVQIIIRQAVAGLTNLTQKNVIHCDLKPENILLVSKNGLDFILNASEARGQETAVTASEQVNASMKIKLIDFGSACFEGHTAHSYIQSRFYRSPEVLLGLPYDSAIDIWSMGCVAAEMFLGLPILPGVHEHDQLGRISEMIGRIPDWMLDQGDKSTKFYVKSVTRPPSSQSAEFPNGFDHPSQSSASQLPQWRLKTQDEFIRSLSQEEIFKKGGLTKLEKQPGQRYFKKSKLADIVVLHAQKCTAEDRKLLPAFVHFLCGMLDPDPWKRWTAFQANQHPFLTGNVMQIQPKKPDVKLNYKEENQANLQLNLYWEAPWDPAMTRRKLLSVQKMRDEQQAMHQTSQDRSSSLGATDINLLHERRRSPRLDQSFHAMDANGPRQPKNAPLPLSRATSPRTKFPENPNIKSTPQITSGRLSSDQQMHPSGSTSTSHLGPPTQFARNLDNNSDLIQHSVVHSLGPQNSQLNRVPLQTTPYSERSLHTGGQLNSSSIRASSSQLPTQFSQSMLNTSERISGLTATTTSVKMAPYNPIPGAPPQQHQVQMFSQQNNHNLPSHPQHMQTQQSFQQYQVQQPVFVTEAPDGAYRYMTTSATGQPVVLQSVPMMNQPQQMQFSLPAQQRYDGASSNMPPQQHQYVNQQQPYLFQQQQQMPPQHFPQPWTTSGQQSHVQQLPITQQGLMQQQQHHQPPQQRGQRQRQARGGRNM